MAGVSFDFQLPPSDSDVVVGDSKKDAPKPEPVSEPHEHDVLCGRGGLTNHHPGNAWYRRLVRSNRPLYRSSPKHTKLLVAKAIVHHVQSQNPSGRFLECQRKSGLWFPVSYKRAADKTSQALRERDREGEGITDTELMTPKDAPAPPEGVVQAAMSTGKPKDDDKSIKQDNAGGAILEPPGLQQSSSWFWRNNKKQKTEEEEEPLPLPTAPLTERASSIFRFFSTSKLIGNDTNDSGIASAPNQQPEMAQSNAGSSFNRYKDDPLMNPFNSAPSPPRTTATSNINAHAMNRGDIPVGMHLEPPRRSMTPLLPQQQPQQQQHLTFGTSQQHSGGLEPLPPAGLGAMDPLPLADISKRKRSRDSFESGGNANAPGMAGGPDAPSLTRLTTQMSDWLQSFWPLGDERGREQSQQMQQMQMQQQQEQMQHQQMHYQQQNNSNNNNTMSQEELQRQLLDMSTSLNQLQSQLQNSNNNNGNNGGNSTGNNLNGSNSINNNNSASTDISNQVQMQMQQLQKMRDSIVASAMDNNNYNNAPSAPPMTLTASVSSTFLQLASSPSRLFSGLSTFFSENGQKSRAISQVGGPGGSEMMMGVGGGMMGPNTSMGMNQNAMGGMGVGANTSKMHPNAMGGMNGMISAPMMDTNNSVGLVPAPMSLGAVSISNGGLNTGFHGEFGTPTSATTDQLRPNFGRRSSGRCLLDDD
jgi:hypothetical protein